MKKIKKLYSEIYQEQKGMFLLLIFLAMLGFLVGIIMVANLRPSGSVIKILYSDLQGYKDGNWRELVIFPMMALMIGVLNNILIVRIYQQKGKTVAKIFAWTSILLLIVLVGIFGRLISGGLS